MPTGEVVEVEVKSSWASKINWTQAIALLAGVLTYFGVEMDEATKQAVLATIVGASAVITWVLRTWFTSKVTPSSAAKVK
ncbi:MAG: hypothetical protein ABIH23_13640 [bacterium]